jgi:hypothetical protein
LGEFFDKGVKWFPKGGRQGAYQKMRRIGEGDEGLKTDLGRAEPAALPAPSQYQRAGNDAVQFMTAGYEMLQPG